MKKDYVTIGEEVVDVLGHKVKVVTERFSDEYLDSKRFQSRCLRCIFNPGHPSYKAPCICRYLRCTQYRGDEATHFELVDENN